MIRVLCVDDEPLLLENLRRQISSIELITDAEYFTNEFKALVWAEEHPVDVAFLDIQLHIMTGLELAQKLRTIHPKIICIFCTAYPQYAVDAIDLNLTDGYLLKPIRAADIELRLKKLMERRALSPALLSVRLGKQMELYSATGTPIDLKRSKSRQLLQLLIEHNGEELDTVTLCNLLWTDNDHMLEKNRNYLWSIASYLRATLEAYGAGEVLRKQHNGYSIDMSLVEILKR